MPEFFDTPTIIPAAGNLPKIIREYFGQVNSGDRAISFAHMTSPSGWTEPGQTPEFDEFTIVLSGCVVVETREQKFNVNAGQGIHTKPGEWVRYSTPDGADYLAICLPAFSPNTVHRDE